MGQLASIIIPCFNAEKWVREAIESCLNQTYRPIEIIVIDDGSTDRSLEIIKSFGDNIRFETGPNRGGNTARNLGFAISKGEFIQFLDADDCLLPEKIERQVSCLESGKADVVYGDWRHQHHRPDGKVELEEAAISGEHADILAALLSDWWVAPAAILFRRSAVERAGGWDESLTAAQDRDFFISVAMTGATIVYQPGCHSIYRRYGNVTVSTGNRLRWLDNHSRVLDKSAAALGAKNDLKSKYQKALASSYFNLARTYYDLDRGKYRDAMKKVFALDPEFQPKESAIYGTAQRLFGFDTAELLASWKRRLLACSRPIKE